MGNLNARWVIPLYFLLLALVLATAGYLIVTTQVLLLIFAGVVFGVLLNRLAAGLSRLLPLPYRASYVVVLVSLILLVGGGCYYSGSRIAGKVSELTTELTSAVKQLDEQLRRSSWGPEFVELAGQIEHAVSDGDGLVPEIVSMAGSVLWGATAAAVIAFVGLYVAFDPDLYETGILKLFPPENRDRSAAVLHTLRTALVSWIVGRTISMSIIGVSTIVGLWLLDVPLPISLGVMAALFTFIPNFGPLLATVPQALLAFQVSPATVLYVLVFNVTLQTAESYFITPTVMRYEATLPPVLTISAQLLMTVLVGTIGIIMAAPLTVVLMVLVQTLYIRDTLGDSKPGQLTERQ